MPTLEALLAGPHEVVGVVSQPDRRRGRGKKVSPSPISEVALREGLPLLRPERVGDPESVATLRSLSPDLGVVVAFGQFLPRSVRELPSYGYLINAHASLLPSYRGASPIASAILAGERETGISVMRIEREMDAGPVALVRKTAIRPQENTAELTQRLGALAASAIVEVVDAIARDAVEWTQQEAERATLAPKLEKTESLLDLRERAIDLAARIHALAPRPGARLRLLDGDHEEILKVLRAEVQPVREEQPSAVPGTIDLEASPTELRIATGEGWLVPTVLQRAGGKAMPVADFLRGYPLGSSARFAVEDPKLESEPR